MVRFRVRVVILLVSSLITLCSVHYIHIYMKNIVKTTKSSDDLRSYSMYLPPRRSLSSEQRIEMLSTHCSKEHTWATLTTKQRQTLKEHVIVDDKNHLLYCYVPKVASNNWKRVLLSIKSNIKKPEHFRIIDRLLDLPLLSELSFPEIKLRLNTYFKFMFVREPIERLVSAYRSKLLVNNSYFNAHYSPVITSKYRKPNNSTSKVTMNEFFRWLVDQNIADMNEHWMPASFLCQPCVVKYDFIGSYDNINEDANRVFEKLKLQDKVQFPYKSLFGESFESVSSTDQLLGEVDFPVFQGIVQKYVDDYKFFSFPIPTARNEIMIKRIEVSKESDT